MECEIFCGPQIWVFGDLVPASDENHHGICVKDQMVAVCERRLLPRGRGCRRLSWLRCKKELPYQKCGSLEVFQQHFLRKYYGKLALAFPNDVIVLHPYRRVISTAVFIWSSISVGVRFHCYYGGSTGARV